MSKFPTPTCEGFYWARLVLAEDPSVRSWQWEPVHVFDNILRPWCEADIETGEHMMVSVQGLEEAKNLEDFLWGPGIPVPEELK